MRDRLQELRELGWRRTLFRLAWEGRTRTTTVAFSRSYRSGDGVGVLDINRLPFSGEAPVGVLERDPERLDRLRTVAVGATQGRILCFGRWAANYGAPLQWHQYPAGGESVSSGLPWPVALREAQRIGDIKQLWEVGRFPQAFHMCRAASWLPETADQLHEALLSQIESFVANNEPGYGVHWASGQETVIRLLAWLFFLSAIDRKSTMARRLERLCAAEMDATARFLDEHIGYARFAVYNNHLISEALGLYMAGTLLGSGASRARWLERGSQLLNEAVEAQFYKDGGYIQNSHNYHRMALQLLMLAVVVAKRAGVAEVPVAWVRAVERSVDFLHAHQCGTDGRLPNFGPNDGSLVLPLTNCDFSDFRPTLQAASLMCRGERLYGPGPWDEEAVWLLGAGALDAPARGHARRSVSFCTSGYHVLRNDEATFATFRCGSLLERFAQIDMLHVDVWWQGSNVVADPGSYRYGGARQWHAHFTSASAHNTVTVDGQEQMVHLRQFKTVYWTKAAMLEFAQQPGIEVCAGEHYGFARRIPGCVHRRTIIAAKPNLWAVVDSIFGSSGKHSIRVHWQCGLQDYTFHDSKLSLRTGAGDFSIAAFDRSGNPLPATVVSGSASPVAGWVSRYYGELQPRPSLMVDVRGSLPITVVSVLGAHAPELHFKAGRYLVRNRDCSFSFQLSHEVVSDIVCGKERPASVVG